MTVQTTILNAIESGAITTISSYTTHIAVGTGTSTPLVSQTTLDSEVLRENVFSTESPANNKLLVSMFLDTTEANGNTIGELGIFNASSGGTMVSRNKTNSLAKDSSTEVYYEVEYEVNASN